MLWDLAEPVKEIEEQEWVEQGLWLLFEKEMYNGDEVHFLPYHSLQP